jgi:hypothetical protein
MSKRLAEIAVGDFVSRWLGDAPIPMRLKVTEVTADRIICAGVWEFDRKRQEGCVLYTGAGAAVEWGDETCSQ